MGSCLLEHVMKQFRYVQNLLINLIVIVPPTMYRRDVDVIFGDYYENLIPKDVLSMSDDRSSSTKYGYIQ